MPSTRVRNVPAVVAGGHRGSDKILGAEEIRGRPTPERAKQISSWTSRRRESAIEEGTLTGAGTTPPSAPLAIKERTSADEDEGIPGREDIVVGLAGSELQIVSDAMGARAENE